MVCRQLLEAQAQKLNDDSEEIESLMPNGIESLAAKEARLKASRDELRLLDQEKKKLQTQVFYLFYSIKFILKQGSQFYFQFSPSQARELHGQISRSQQLLQKLQVSAETEMARLKRKDLPSTSIVAQRVRAVEDKIGRWLVLTLQLQWMILLI